MLFCSKRDRAAGRRVAFAKSVRRATEPVIHRLESRTFLTAVTATTPTNGSQAVSVSSNLTVTFDVAMNASTINSSTLQLRDSTNTTLPATVTYNSASKTATIDPTSNFASTADYYFVNVVGGSNGVKDSGGNAMASDFIFSFTTGTPTFNEQTVFSGLTQPTAIEFAPNGKIFIAEKRGIVKVFDSLTDTTATQVVDLRTATHNFWDRGLLGLAVDPQFPTRPYIYVLYTYDAPIGGTAPVWGSVGGDSDSGPGTTGNAPAVSGRLSRLTLSGDTATSETILINDWAQQYPSHSIGHLQFGPDGNLYASAGDGASFNAVDYGQNNIIGDPVNEGGAVRSQDIRSDGDPAGLDGTIIRINPDTGAAVSSNPYSSSSDANKKRVIANGLRNPFRFNFRPGTNEIWAADVGWNNWEEINRITNTGDSTAENFGWPAFEGNGVQTGYQNANLPLLNSFIASNSDTKPYYAWGHSEKVVPGSAEPTGGSSATGVAFYNGGTYPVAFDGAMFFADYSRKQIYIMYEGPNGLPDVSTRKIFKSTTNGAVELQTGPNGDLYYVDLDGGRIRRFTFDSNDRAPTAVIAVDKTSGNAPLTVNFNGTGSSDPDPGDTITFSWDLNGDGVFGDSTSATPSRTYTTIGTYNVQLRVTDRAGVSNTDSIVISVGQAQNTPPVPTILTPLTSLRWKVGDSVSFSGSATDAEDGSLSAAKLKWDVVMVHGNEIDPNNTHTHFIQSFDGIASGSFIAQDHEYPSWMELRLTATDSQGASTTIIQKLDPQTVLLNFGSSPSGMQIDFNGTLYTTPFARTVIAGSTSSAAAVSPQNVGGVNYFFSSWNDAGDRAHQIVAGTSNSSYTATFATQVPFLNTPFQPNQRIEAEYFDEGDNGQAYRDVSSGNAGGAYRSTDVDLEVTGDVDGNYNLGWAESGEYLEYTISVPTSGYYVFDARVACPTVFGNFHVEFAGVDKTGKIDVPNTGSWQDWTTVSKVVQLSAGTQIMKVAMDQNSIYGSVGNFNWFRVRDYTPLSAPSNLAATALNANQIRLNWSDNSSDETGFKIERKLGAGGTWQQITQVGGDVTTYLDPSLLANNTYFYRVRATDGTTNGAYSNEANASTSNSQTPYFGTPFGTGQTIEAEAFDVGGPGVAYFDQNTGNNGGQFRSEDVDIEGTSDTGGGANVGWAEEGEWLEYTVNVPAAGSYQFDARAAGLASGGVFHVEFDGVDRTGQMTVPNTGGWQTWATTSRLISLPAGVQTMRVVLDNNSPYGSVGNFNWFKLTPSAIASGDGLSATYFNNMDFTGTTVTRIDPRIDFNWGVGSPDSNIAPYSYSARWTGQVKADHSETYTFYTRSDDGARLWVNGQLLIDKWIDQAATEYSGSITLVAGQKYDIKMEYYQNGGGSSARLQWSSASTPKTTIPQANLFSSPMAPAGIIATRSVYSDAQIFGPTKWQQEGLSVLDQMYGVARV
jgi:glucose/arabinose dehydrogenase